MTVTQVVGMSATLIGVAVIYLASPNQQWMTKRPFTFKVGAFVGVLFLVIGWLFFRINFSFLSSFFASATLSMLLLGLMPLSSRLKEPVREGIKNRAKFISKSKKKKYGAQWWLDFLPHVLLGLPMSLSLVGLFAWMSPGSITDSYKSQTVMWMVAPLWFTPTALAFFLPRKQTTTFFYVALNLLLFGLLWFIKTK